MVGGTSHPRALTADADSGARLQGSSTVDVLAPEGDAFTAPSEDAERATAANPWRAVAYNIRFNNNELTFKPIF